MSTYCRRLDPGSEAGPDLEMFTVLQRLVLARDWALRSMVARTYLARDDVKPKISDLDIPDAGL
jgi:hypothetical protein